RRGGLMKIVNKRIVWGLGVCLLWLAGATQVLAKAEDENAKAEALFESLFEAELKRSPEFMSYLGIKTDYGKWDDISLAREKENHEFTRQQLKQLKRLQPKKLNETNALSYQLYKDKLQREL